MEHGIVAILLAGGLGTRLRPLTQYCPKPLVPVANIPFLIRRLRRLQAQGVNEAILAVHYLADRFRSIYQQAEEIGIRLHIVEEHEPLGTAGAARYVVTKQLHHLDRPVLVLNGDLLTDLDISMLLAAHRRAQALVTIAVAEVQDPAMYGVVATDTSGRVHAFQEKPAPGTELARTVNTGSYVLEPAAFEYIPSNTFTMFERDLFPSLLDQRLPIAAFRNKATWIDIGTIAGYSEANAAVLEGRLQDEPLPGHQIAPGIWIEDDVCIDPSASVRGPVVLGRGTVVEAQAHLTGPLVIGAQSHIGTGAVLERSILWERTSVGAKAYVSRAILAHEVSIAPSAQIKEKALG